MKVLEDYRQTRRNFSSLASDVARKLGFAGIATIWIYRTENPSRAIPADLVWPALFIVVALAFDLLQYAVSAAIYGAYQRILEYRDTPEDQDLGGHPPWFNWPNNVFFWGKLVLIVVAYWNLISFLWRTLV